MVTEEYDESNESIKRCLSDYVVGEYTEPEKDEDKQNEQPTGAPQPRAAENAAKRQTSAKLVGKDIKLQAHFNEVYKTADTGAREKLLGNKYAISSEVVQRNPVYYFCAFENQLEKALDNYRGQVPREIILKYYKQLAGMKNYRGLLYRVMDKETLETHSGLVEVCRKFVMSTLGEGNSTKAVYKYSELLNIPSIELYQLTIKHLCSATITCDLDRDNAHLYYTLLQEHLTQSDYKAVIKTNSKVLTKIKTGDECWQVAVMAVVAFQKNLIEEIPAQLRGPHIFAVDTQHSTLE